MTLKLGEEHLDQDGIIDGGKGCVTKLGGYLESFWRSRVFKIWEKKKLT